jgi:hypothetical protein
MCKSIIQTAVCLTSIVLILQGGISLSMGCNPEYPTICPASYGLQTQTLTNITTGTNPCVVGSSLQCYYATYDFQTCAYAAGFNMPLYIGTSYHVYVGSTGVCVPALARPELTSQTNSGIILLAVGGFLLIVAALYPYMRKWCGYICSCRCIHSANRQLPL